MTDRDSILDVINIWSEIKLEIIRKYAAAYATILGAQSRRFRYGYIDAFAGPGEHISKETGDIIPGSPLVALNIEPQFQEYHFIDLRGEKVQHLREITGDLYNIRIHEGDCNDVLLQDIFPRFRYKDYRRALCLLDPYGLHLNWDVIHKAGQMRSIEIWLNFPISDINRNVLRRNPSNVNTEQAARLSRWWGDTSWREVAYESKPGLFGEMKEKVDNETVAEAFRKRLKEKAGFAHVPNPLPMRNSKGATVYYLFFASHNANGAKIARDILKRYR